MAIFSRHREQHESQSSIAGPSSAVRGVARNRFPEGLKEGGFDLKAIKDAVAHLGYRHYADAVKSLYGKPPVPLEGTEYCIKYDNKFRRFFICDTLGYFLVQICPIQRKKAYKNYFSHYKKTGIIYRQFIYLTDD